MSPVPRSVKILLAIFPFVSLFFSPWPMTLIAAVAAGFVFPPLPLFVGLLADILYFPGGAVPQGIIMGAIVALFTYAVRHFVKTRIM